MDIVDSIPSAEMPFYKTRPFLVGLSAIVAVFVVAAASRLPGYLEERAITQRIAEGRERGALVQEGMTEKQVDAIMEGWWALKEMAADEGFHKPWNLPADCHVAFSKMYDQTENAMENWCYVLVYFDGDQKVESGVYSH
jgi:hypothetical protein